MLLNELTMKLFQMLIASGRQKSPGIFILHDTFIHSLKFVLSYKLFKLLKFNWIKLKNYKFMSIYAHEDCKNVPLQLHDEIKWILFIFQLMPVPFFLKYSQFSTLLLILVVCKFHDYGWWFLMRLERVNI